MNKAQMLSFGVRKATAVVAVLMALSSFSIFLIDVPAVESPTVATYFPVLLFAAMSLIALFVAAYTAFRRRARSSVRPSARAKQLPINPELIRNAVAVMLAAATAFVAWGVAFGTLTLALAEAETADEQRVLDWPAHLVISFAVPGIIIWLTLIVFFATAYQRQQEG